MNLRNRIKPNIFGGYAGNLASVFGLLLSAVLACGGAPGSLDAILSAKNPKDFNEAYLQHGPLRAEEVQSVYQATSSYSTNKRRNAAKLLITTTKGDAVNLQHKGVAETKDVVVWAILIDDLLEKEPELAGKRTEMIKDALASTDPDTLAVGLRAGTLSNYPGTRELARKYLDSPDGKVRAAAVSGLSPDDIRELLPKLTDMIGKEKDEDTFISLAKSLIRTSDANATDIVIKAIEKLKADNDSLWLHFFNNLAFAAPDPITDKFLFALAGSRNTVRDEGFSVLARQIWANHREPYARVVSICTDEIAAGNLSTDPRRKPDASESQDDCEILLSFINNGKNPIEDFDHRVRGADAVAFGKKWLTDHPGNN